MHNEIQTSGDDADNFLLHPCLRFATIGNEIVATTIDMFFYLHVSTSCGDLGDYFLLQPCLRFATPAKKDTSMTAFMFFSDQGGAFIDGDEKRRAPQTVVAGSEGGRGLNLGHEDSSLEILEDRAVPYVFLA